MSSMPSLKTRLKHAAMLLGVIATFGLSGGVSNLAAEAVDSELVLLVDVTRPGLTDPQFDDLMSSYAQAFTSPEMMASIQAGAIGRLAVSVMFFGNAATQVVGVPWMSIGSLAEANTFASQVTNAARPFSLGFSAPAEGLAAATASIGTETGGVGNGFESNVQVIEVAASGVPFFFNATATGEARDAALAAGVDLMNTTSLGFFGGIAEDYYEENVIGTTLPDVEASSSTSGLGPELATNLADNLTVAVDTAVTADAVPEPSSALLAMVALGFGLLRRRR